MTKALTTYMKSLVPDQVDRQKVSARRSRVETALKQAGLDLIRMYESGSFSHGTGIAKKSDVDYMAWLSIDDQTQRPSTILRKMRDALEYSDAQITSVSISSPTVQIRYTSEPHFEVVPGFLHSYTDGEPMVFQIPGRSDEWVNSSPSSHNKYVSDVNDRLGKKAKPLIRLVKAWRYGNAVPVSSFYLEMRTAKYLSEKDSVVYSVDLEYAMRAILNRKVADLNDPANAKVGRIPACSSEEKRRVTAQALSLAVDSLDAAHELAHSGEWLGYYIAMRDVFPDFPYAEGW